MGVAPAQSGTRHRNLTSHFACLCPSFLICKNKGLELHDFEVTSSSDMLGFYDYNSPSKWTAFSSGFKGVAFVLQYHKGRLGKSQMKSLCSALVTSPSLNPTPTLNLKAENMAQEKFTSSSIYMLINYLTYQEYTICIQSSFLQN